MQVTILEMPMENAWKVKVDDQDVPGRMVKNVKNERWRVYFTRDDFPEQKQLRTEPHSREGAACLLLFHHFEQERKRLRARSETGADS